jgi:hypothetical protein
MQQSFNPAVLPVLGNHPPTATPTAAAAVQPQPQNMNQLRQLHGGSKKKSEKDNFFF